MKRILLTVSSIGALALASCTTTHQTATDAACTVCGKDGCTACAAGEACTHCGKEGCTACAAHGHKH